MASLDMFGPYPLDNPTIDREVPHNSTGNYGLGNTDAQGLFHVHFVGRSDYDVNSKLKELVGNYTHFKYSRAFSTIEAFEKECRNFHDFRPSDNRVHPDRPLGRTWRCPRCHVFG